MKSCREENPQRRAKGKRNGLVIATPGNKRDSIPAVFACDYSTGGGHNQANDGMYIACNWLQEQHR